MLLRFDPFARLDRRPAPAAARVPFDAERSDDRLVLRFDLPGFQPGDIDLTVDRGVLTLEARRSIDTGDATVLRRERFSGPVSRRLAVGDRYDTGAVEASFDNGVLTVTLPVAEAARPRRVEIAAASADSPTAADVVEQAETGEQAAA